MDGFSIQNVWMETRLSPDCKRDVCIVCLVNFDVENKECIVFALRLFFSKIPDTVLEYFIHRCPAQKKRPLAQKSEKMNQLN